MNAEQDDRKVVVVNPADEDALRPLALALDLNLVVSRWGPAPGQVYLFDPAAIPAMRVESQYLDRPFDPVPGDPWGDMRRQILDGLRPGPFCVISGV